MINIYLFIASHNNIGLLKYQAPKNVKTEKTSNKYNPEPALGVLKMFVITVTIA